MVLRNKPVEVANVYWQKAWEVAGPRYPVLADASPADDQEFRAELLFCLLGGHGISYEHNLSVADHLWSLGLLRSEGSALTRCSIEAQLRRPQFEPPRVNGALRRYRFPKRKANFLYGAQAWLRNFSSLTSTFAEIACERQRRELLCQCPGIGPKSASWLLRNTGYAERLAILDVHVLRAMRSCGRLDRADLPRDYELIENAYLRWCNEFDFDPARFDLLVWDFSRQRV